MDLLIGNTSQLRYYVNQHTTDLVSSRKFNYTPFGYDNVIIAFAEQRTFLNLNESDFIDVNVTYTSKIIDNISNTNKKIIVFGTSELWNNYNGPITINDNFNYNYSPYIKSKEILFELIKEKQLKGLWGNVFMVHPFNFNSPYRNKGFVFGKIIDALINKKQITVGNLNINRDIIHPKLVIESIKNIKSDIIVGSGVLVNIKNFCIELFNHYNTSYYDFILENVDEYSRHQGKNFYLNTDKLYTNLLYDTIFDIDLYKKQNKI